MTRPSLLRLLRISAFSVIAALAWLGCVKDESGGAGLPTCPQYCDELEAKCAKLEYKDRDQCLAVCALMKDGPESSIDDTSGCRLANARKATKDDAASCKKASAFGGAACGSPCTTFCALVDEICIKSDEVSVKPYTSESSCIEECAAIKYDAAGEEGQNQPFAGPNNLNCRMFHLLLALEDRPGHCPHTAPVSAVCTQ